MTDVQNAVGGPSSSSYEALFHTMPCGLVTTTSDSTVIEVNDTLLEWTGYPREHFVGSSFTSLLEVGSQMFYETRHLAVLRLTGEVKEVALRLARSDGRALPVLINSRMVPARDGADGLVRTALFDTSERHEFERELVVARRAAESSERRVRVLQDVSGEFVRGTTAHDVAEALARSLRLAFSASASAVFVFDEVGVLHLAGGSSPVADLDVLQEPIARALDSEAIVEIPQTAVLPYAEALRAARVEALSIMPVIDGRGPTGLSVCWFGRAREFDDHYRDLQVALGRQAAQALLRIRLQDELERLALHDQLTGLANRNLIQHVVADAITDSRAQGHSMAVIFLDLDGFKQINDRAGHAAGDEVLREVAHRLQDSVRHDDAVGRFGGDEFVVVCQPVDRAGALTIADRIADAVRAPLEGTSAGQEISASIGIAFFDAATADAPSADMALNIADDAMYQAKTRGRDGIVLVDVHDADKLTEPQENLLSQS